MKFWTNLLLAVLPLLTQAAELPQTRHKFVVIAHRGNHARAHENTLTALQHAIDAGADYAEIDVRRTVDGHYVLMHDRDVERMTDGHGAVARLTLAQIRNLRVQDLSRPQIPADRVPTFEEALQLIKGQINIYLDFKEGERSVVAKAIRDAGVTRQILVYDGDEAVAEWHRVAPELPLIVSLPDDIKTAQQMLQFAKSKDIEVLDGSWRGYSAETVQAVQPSGLKIWPDIQSAKENADYFKAVLKLGVSGVQTDHPEALIAWLQEHHLR